MDFRQKLKALYKRNDKIAPLIEGLEGEIPQQTLDDYYVKLKTIIKEDEDKKQANYETISGQKQQVEIEDIFEQAQIRRLLILGGAGVGKSTLMQYMAYRWSTNGLWNDKFDYVYRVTLKTLLNVGWDRDYDKEDRKDELKCLVHYNLVAQGEEDCKLQDMPWIDKKGKILLLLDGYDEVAHERNGMYKKLFEKIFEHENIILTSRPNAIDKQMAENFGKKIENTGLDYEGIQKYLTQYFKKNQEKGETLKEFLDKNSSIKEICHIPVNIAMMCFIWSEGDSNQALHEISNMSDLYKQVVDQLGFRYFAKQQSNLQQNQDELMSKWRGGDIYLDELQVLEYTAYKGMTGGGLQVPEDKRLETLIIKGMTKKGDKDGISIQSSINYLRDQLKKDMPTINKVYKYGLLKPEGVIIDLKKNPKKELSETDLQEQSFSFIHLSFQEFLTALYLVQHLLKENNKEEQERVANFIAQHRNEPRYLMTLKLMAGILTAHDDNQQAGQAIKIFWDAILCNPDGVLELGVEAKVTLLMHLFGQANKGDSLDERIPNVNIAVDLIDSVVLEDIARWGAQLKESDYLSEKIKEGLLQCLIENNVHWMSEMSCKLQEKSTKQIKKSNNNVPIETIIEIIESIINKFSQDQQEQISKKLLELIKTQNAGTKWQLTKKALETLFIMHQKSKLSLNHNELLDAFLIAAYDGNLTTLASKGMLEILNIKANTSLMDRVTANIKEEKGKMKAEDVINTKLKLLKLVNRDIQLYRDVIDKSLVPFLQNSIRDVRILASNTITELVKISQDNQLILDAIKILLPYIKNPEMRDSVSCNIKTLMDNTAGQQVIRDYIDTLKPLLQDYDSNVKTSIAAEIYQIIMINDKNIDVELVLDLIKALVQALSSTFGSHHYTIKDPFSNQINDFTKICHNNPQIAKQLIQYFTTLFTFEEHQEYDSSELAMTSIITIMQMIDKNDLQFTKDIITMMALLVESPDPTTSWCAASTMVNIAKKVNTELAKQTLDTFAPFLANPSGDLRQLIARSIQDITPKDIQFVKHAINIMIPLLKHADNAIKQSTLSAIQAIIEKQSDLETQFIHDLIMKNLIPLLQEPDSGAKGAAFFCLSKIIQKSKLNNNPQLIKTILKTAIPLLQDPDRIVRKTISWNFYVMFQDSTNNETHLLIVDVIKALIPLLQDSEKDVKTSTAYSIFQLIKNDHHVDDQLKRDVVDSLAPLLQDPAHDVRSSVAKSLAELANNSQDANSELPRHVMNILAQLLQDSHPDVRGLAASGLLEMVKASLQLLQDVLNLLTPALQDSNNNVKRNALVGVFKIVEINHKDDPQMTRDIINLLFPLTKDSDRGVKVLTLENFAKLASTIHDSQLSRETITIISPAIQDSEDSIRKATSKSIMDIIKTISDPDTQLIRDVMETLTPLFKDPSQDLKMSARDYIVELVGLTDKSDAQLKNDAFDLVCSLFKDPDGYVRKNAPVKIPEYITKIDIQLSRNAIEALLPALQEDPERDVKWAASNAITSLVQKTNDKSDIEWIQGIVNSMISFSKENSGHFRASISENITEIANFVGDAQLVKHVIQSFLPFFSDVQASDKIKQNIKQMVQINGHSADIINLLIPLLRNHNYTVRTIICSTLTEIITTNKEAQIHQDLAIKSMIPRLKDLHPDVRLAALKNIAELAKSNTQLVQEVIKSFVPLLKDPENPIRLSASTSLKEILAANPDDLLVKDTISLVSPLFQHSNSDIARNTIEILQSVFPRLLLVQPESFAQYLTHSSKHLRDTVISYLLPCLQKYINDFQQFDQLFQRPVSDLTAEAIVAKLFEGRSPPEDLTSHLSNSEQLKSLLVSEINKIEGLKGSQIIELAIVIIGQEKVPNEDSDRQKLIELAKEVLPIQLKYLNEEGLIWINKNCQRLLLLSSETKLFYKKVYHKLLEDEQITSLEEELLIKFINQGLTSSLTRNGEIIFEGKRYKLKGEDIELALEKIAKTVIDQQQDLLAMQYKEHEPIFKISYKGGMTQAAADIKEIKSLVDSRHTLKADSWLITRLKSLKFNSEIVLLEQRSAFGDHVLYHFSHQKLLRFYPNEIPILQEIFGSYIYGEAYQGEITELTDEVGQNLLKSKAIKPAKVQEGKLCSKQIYFQQELLKQGNEDRNSAIEEELAKKLDNNRVVLEAKLKSFNLQDSERVLIEDYYEGFISTFSSVYTSSQAVDSGKLSIDDGEDFFSPVNIFIQLTSLAPFGIGEVLSGGLEAARSYIRSNEMKNEARFVKDIAIDAVELSDLVSKIALVFISNKEQRKKIVDAKDNDEELNGLINKVKNLVNEKLEKLKNLAEKYSKMKNLFEKEIATSPAFRLGESDANKIIKDWIDLKGAQPDLRLKPEEKQKQFVKIIIGENTGVGESNKIAPEGVKPSAKGKTGCCEIF